MIESLVKPGMMNSSDWRYGCSLIQKTGEASLPVYFLGVKIIACTYYFVVKLFNTMKAFRLQ